MFPSTATDDPGDQRGQRTLEVDDVVSSSELYPVGVEAAFGVVAGSIRNAAGEPVIGVSVFCRDLASREVVASTFAGTARLLFSTDGPQSVAAPENGDFSLLLPPGRYECGIEAVDGAPVRGLGTINSLVSAAAIAGNLPIEEELFSGSEESALELRPGAGTPIVVRAGERTEGIDFVTNRRLLISTFTGGVPNPREEGDRALELGVAPDRILAAIVARPILAEALGAFSEAERRAGLALPSVAFRVAPSRPSEVARFAFASLNRCSLGDTNALDDGPELRVDLRDPIQIQAPFVGQDRDDTPLFMDDPVAALREVIQVLEDGTGARALCLVLGSESRDEADLSPGPKILADPAVAPEDAGTVGAFVSSDGGRSFQRASRPFQFMLSLTAVPVP